MGDADKKRRHRAATSRAMKRVAEARKCPCCGKKSALSRHSQPFLPTVYVCRWCGHEHAAGDRPGDTR